MEFEKDKRFLFLVLALLAFATAAVWESNSHFEMLIYKTKEILIFLPNLYITNDKI